MQHAAGRPVPRRGCTGSATRNPSSRVISLCNASIVCRFDRQTLWVGPEPGSGDPLRIDLARLGNPHEFAAGLFQGAICPTPSPPLPSDELLG